MKGIILAGGAGTRLYPLTKVISKQLLPVYDKPMIYYALSVLMLAQIREILIISTPRDLPRFKQLLSDGSELGLSLSYLEQKEPEGLAQAFLIGKSFIQQEDVALVLGDNLFIGKELQSVLLEAALQASKGFATIFGYGVADARQYGVVEVDQFGHAISIEEKPVIPRSNICVTGLYMYDNRVVTFAEQVKPSSRGELEITDINRMYLEDGSLKVSILDHNYTWFDMGTVDNLLEAGAFVKQWQDMNAELLLAPETIAYKQGWINQAKLEEFLLRHKSTLYQAYLTNLLR